MRLRAKEELTKIMEKVADGTPRSDIKELDQTPWDRILPRDQQTRSDLVHQAFKGTGAERVKSFKAATPTDLPGKWEDVDGKIRVYLIGRFALSKGAALPPSFLCEVVAGMESQDKIDLATFTENTPAVWRLASLSITSMVVPEDKMSMEKRMQPKQ